MLVAGWGRFHSMRLMFRGSPGAWEWRFIARSCMGRLAEPWRVDVVSGGGQGTATLELANHSACMNVFS